MCLQHNAIFLHVFVLFRPSKDCMIPPTLGRATSFTESTNSNANLNWNRLTDTPWNNVPSDLWASSDSVKLMHKISYHIIQWNATQQQNKLLIHSKTWIGQNYFTEWNKPPKKIYIGLYKIFYKDREQSSSCMGMVGIGEWERQLSSRDIMWLWLAILSYIFESC